MIPYYATALDASGCIPSIAENMWLAHLAPELKASSIADAALAIVVVHSLPHYTFDPVKFKILEQSKLPIIVFDYNEPSDSQQQFLMLYEALTSVNVVGWFKRELQTGAAYTGCPVWPLDFTTPRFDAYDTVESREAFGKRPLDILMTWGYSSLDRVKLHGALMTQFDKFRSGTAPAQVVEDVEKAIERRSACPMALLYTPDYRRLPLAKVFWLQSQAKLTISLFGNGKRCFRSSEAGYNSVMAIEAPETLQWSYPWVDKHNCVALPIKENGELDIDKAVNTLHYWTVLDHGALYTLYLHGVVNGQRYVNETYGRDYLVPRIKSVCATS